MGRREHWENVYRTKGDAELSWFQVHPDMSLSLIDSLNPPARRVIDVGGGQSLLAAELVTRGIPEVAVLDISSAAIERARARLGPFAERVRWINADVLDAPRLGEFDLWHDRAVFHFLMDEDDRRRYIEAVERAVPVGGHVMVATFALMGPPKCSGLDVHRYDGPRLLNEFGPSFRMVSSAAETHSTPWGKKQDFTYVLLRRVDGD